MAMGGGEAVVVTCGLGMGVRTAGGSAFIWSINIKAIRKNSVRPMKMKTKDIPIKAKRYFLDRGNSTTLFYHF